MLATQSILSDQYCITLAVTDKQTHNTYICVLFFSLLFLLTNNISTLCTRPVYGNTLDLMRCFSLPPPTVSFKLLQYILLLYLRKIHYLGKLCILVQGFLLCRNEHKHKINERVWALNWSWIVKKFVFSLYLFFCCKSLHFDHAVSTLGLSWGRNLTTCSGVIQTSKAHPWLQTLVFHYQNGLGGV